MSGLRIEKLEFAYPGAAPVLRGVDLEVAPREIYCLLGANGSGKSTLLACILGFLTPQHGTICVDGLDCGREPQAVRRRLAYVPESVALWGFLTAWEHVRLFADVMGTATDPGECLATFGLPKEAWRQRAGTFSKGMRQRLALALATMGSPRVALLDEPTSGLDPDSAQSVANMLRTLAASGVAVLVVTHDLWLVAQAADRFGILRGGTIVHHGTPREGELLGSLFAQGVSS